MFNGTSAGGPDDGVEPMETDTICWAYLADCGRWHMFEDDPDGSLTSMDLENRYICDSKATFDIFSPTTGISSSIDFSAMLHTELCTGRQRRIQRAYLIERSGCCCFISSPVFWEMVDPKLPYQLIRMNEMSPEYQTVAGFVRTDGLLDRHVVSVSRIQNTDLWELYCRKKKQLKKIKGVKDIKERRLFHGTKASNVNNICTYNFDCRLPCANGHVYGKGVYFATHATHADKYSDWSCDFLPLYGEAVQDQQTRTRTRIIFLARVMVGNSQRGESHFHKPDHKSTTNRYESCVDDTKDPKIYAIFDPNQIYPEYLINYS